MTTIVTRTGKGSSLSWVEADANFTNLNTDKLEASALTPYLTTTTASSTYETQIYAASTYTAKTDLAATTGSSLVGFIQSGTGAVATNAQNKLRDSVSVKDFGAVGDGVVDDTSSFANAITALRAAGGGTLNIGSGSFLLNGVAGADGILTGIVVPYLSANGTDARIRIVGEGKATLLLAGSNGMIIARYSDSHGGIENVTFSGNGKTGVKALAVVPESITQTVSVVNQLYNVFRNIYILNTAEAIWLKPGPRVTAVDSGCWYNKFEDFEILSCTRAIWLDSGSTAGPMNTRNKFINVRGGQTGMNTGLQINGGATNTFYGCDFEGIDSGVTPNTTPTAVKILMSDAWGQSNDDNQFYATFNEANTRDLDNANSSTIIIGGYWIATKFGGGAVIPRILLGGDPSLMPVVIPGLRYSEGVAGYPSGHWGISKEIYDNDFPWQDWSLSTANVTNTASLLDTVSKYSKLNNIVEWHFSFNFDASVSNTELLITPPIAPNNALYLNRYNRNPFCSLFVEDGSGVRKAVEAGWSNTGLFYIKAPTAWSTTGNNNAVFSTVRYHT